MECGATLADGQPITSVTFDVRTVTPTPAPQGYAQLEERKRLTLEHYTRTPDSQFTHSVIWPAVAQYAAGKEVDEALVAWVCDFIAARKDCADFAIQGILRLLAWEQRNEAAGKPFRLSAGLRALMKDTLLGFKYWVDEPGDTVMYMGSENHRLLFHVAEWLAGQLFPLDEFTNEPPARALSRHQGADVRHRVAAPARPVRL